MKPLVTALIFSLVAATANAAEEPTNILSLSVLPLVVEDVGPVITARVDLWRDGGFDNGPFTKVNQRMVNALHDRACKMKMHVEVRQGQTRFQLSDQKAVLTCESGPGANAQVALEGTLYDQEFVQGLNAVGTDDSVLFIVEEGGKEI